MRIYEKWQPNTTVLILINYLNVSRQPILLHEHKYCCSVLNCMDVWIHATSANARFTQQHLLHLQTPVWRLCLFSRLLMVVTTHSVTHTQCHIYNVLLQISKNTAATISSLVAILSQFQHSYTMSWPKSIQMSLKAEVDDFWWNYDLEPLWHLHSNDTFDFNEYHWSTDDNTKSQNNSRY